VNMPIRIVRRGGAGNGDRSSPAGRRRRQLLRAAQLTHAPCEDRQIDAQRDTHRSAACSAQLPSSAWRAFEFVSFKNQLKCSRRAGQPAGRRQKNFREIFGANRIQSCELAQFFQSLVLCCEALGKLCTVSTHPDGRSSQCRVAAEQSLTHLVARSVSKEKICRKTEKKKKNTGLYSRQSAARLSRYGLHAPGRTERRECGG
jgi:hypothetical protein